MGIELGIIIIKHPQNEAPESILQDLGYPDNGWKKEISAFEVNELGMKEAAFLKTESGSTLIFSKLIASCIVEQSPVGSWEAAHLAKTSEDNAAMATYMDASTGYYGHMIFVEGKLAAHQYFSDNKSIMIKIPGFDLPEMPSQFRSDYAFRCASEFLAMNISELMTEAGPLPVFQI
jgi:hypothetical protein